ncbi:uncharacterized protein MELLADRAFT_67720 [Melampsora larici-populina 98AG31]|uniref:Uncharacterized protein n=1 Tax=Melampsora larici-populina (strain 98AG31 / pathotype 3-4-7) TaxID=747676 RepID=F4S4C2_MELLP|nr:uncharacterized protein MELLADRAFT_67720 [Melampsora larici-populina 98AG31]EGG00499.1 hypothetical protein MELLADRAFT_67720 [Melampsora larici-populina 98AG31]
MTYPTRIVNLYSKADLNALLGNSSGDWTDYLPPPSLERRVPSTKPICLTADPTKFRLDMAFNRDGPKRDHNNRFTSEIDPKTLPPTIEGPRSIASDITEHAGKREWRKHWAKWSFPIRKDAPRGLTWGPYHATPEVSLKRPAEDGTLLEEPKRRRIFTVLRSPQKPLIVKLKINQKLLISADKDSKISRDQESVKSSFTKRSRSGSSVVGDIGQIQSKRRCNPKAAPKPARAGDGKMKRVTSSQLAEMFSQRHINSRTLHTPPVALVRKSS